MFKTIAIFTLFCATASFAFPKMSEIHHVHDINGRQYYLVPVDLIQETRYKRQITSTLVEGDLVPPSLLNEKDHKVDETVLPDEHNTSSTDSVHAHEQTSPIDEKQTHDTKPTQEKH